MEHYRGTGRNKWFAPGRLCVMSSSNLLYVEATHENSNFSGFLQTGKAESKQRLTCWSTKISFEHLGF